MDFIKYQGAGNDFVMIDQRHHSWLTRIDSARIEHLCDRRFGIGADGLILLEQVAGYDFEMVYFNADGRESSMCGNGGRCIAAFARDLGIVTTHCRFLAIDGPHEAKMLLTDQAGMSWVELKMSDVQKIHYQENAFVLNTGSPHYVRFETALAQKDMVAEGRAIRYSDQFKQEGINVNLVEMEQNSGHPFGMNIRTYERGVEDETLACGTGVTAAALSSHVLQQRPPGAFEIPVAAKGGKLSVRFQANADGSFSDIWLCGPATFVFAGKIA